MTDEGNLCSPRSSWLQCVQVRSLRSSQRGPALPLKACQREQWNSHQVTEGEDASQERTSEQNQKWTTATQAQGRL